MINHLAKLAAFADGGDVVLNESQARKESNGASAWRSINPPSIFHLPRRHHHQRQQRLGWLPSC
jgi:hypothetical protein